MQSSLPNCNVCHFNMHTYRGVFRRGGVKGGTPPPSNPIFKTLNSNHRKKDKYYFTWGRGAKKPCIVYTVRALQIVFSYNIITLYISVSNKQ